MRVILCIGLFFGIQGLSFGQTRVYRNIDFGYNFSSQIRSPHISYLETAYFTPSVGITSGLRFERSILKSGTIPTAIESTSRTVNTLAIPIGFQIRKGPAGFAANLDLIGWNMNAKNHSSLFNVPFLAKTNAYSQCFFLLSASEVLSFKLGFSFQRMNYAADKQIIGSTIKQNVNSLFIGVRINIEK